MKKANTPGNRRKAAAILAGVLAAALLLSGTLAVVLLNQFDTNIFGGKGLRYDATLNEEFGNGVEDWDMGNAKQPKPVSVTNTGLNNGKYGNVYVRVVLKEFMEMFEVEYKYWDEDGNIVSADGNPGLFMTYTTDEGVTGEPGIEDENHQAHIIITGSGVTPDLDQAQVAAAAALQYPDLVALDPDIFTDRKFVYLTDAVTGISGWFVQTREGDINGQYGKWVIAEFASDASSATPVDPLTTRATGMDHGNYDPGDATECKYTPYIWEDGLEGYERTDLYREWVYLHFGDSVKLLSDWDEEEACWLFDDVTDDGAGWFYWSQPLTPAEPTKTTDLLLEAVQLLKQPESDFYYTIHIDMESVSKSDIWAGTPEPLKTIWGAEEPTAAVGTFRVTASTTSSIPGGTVTFHSYMGNAIPANEVTDDTDWSLSDTPTVTGASAPVGIMPLGLVVPYQCDHGSYLSQTPNVITLNIHADEPAGILYVKAVYDGNIIETPVTVNVTPPPSTVLPVKDPPEGPDGFIPHIDTENPELCDSTQAAYISGVEQYHLRLSSIALETILENSGDVAGTTATAVDPALASFIKTQNNTFVQEGSGAIWGDGKRSIVCEWSDFTTAGLAGLDDAITTVRYDTAHTAILTTDILLTNGDLSATVTVSFYYTHSIIFW